MPNNKQQQNSSAPQGMDGILAERMATGGGALCNDQNGLCLGVRGNIDASKSGVYTSIAKLAMLLDNGSQDDSNEVPLVSIQTDQAALLVKEYGGRTVVFRVPASEGGNGDQVGEIENGDLGDGGITTDE
mmetsp:Transcript_7753/g.16596  ORF Transcript_7753/g.16596 Transcript_7753/m.16596 type:complete len:130 (-) Transcript_7753:206-595(-)|eukprot:CAMPEP_0171341824 /NCGR_PEP_ID=MMETSP0878-20121228/12075_1 /TAXON_ID=67004 /ORGANISM="Thalassiosira weissflogii, Strain CCMP1336" /LENGTH=129 /DNA_ID=CAMNT_0011844263 /DNA_START=96 /DNA_END=485 /DNA_ORIENTATION=-